MFGMSAAVNLDDELPRVTAKIHKVTPDSALSAKMRAFEAGFAKMPPHFRSAGVIMRRSWRASGTRRSFLTVRVLP
jgi:hypothetical protein